MWRGEAEFALGPPRQQAVLASLASRINFAVPRGELIDSVWGESYPATASSSLHTYVAGLRRILEPKRARRRPAELLVSAGGGYRLQIYPEQLDLEAFAAHLARVQTLRAASDLGGALAQLDAALALWRGEALDGIPGPAAAAERTRLAELKLLAMEWRAQVMLDLGRHAEIVAELARVASDNPLRERFWCLLMESLYRCSRQAEALEVFRRARRLLIEELGITPGQELTALHDRIIQGDLEPRAPAGDAVKVELAAGSARARPGPRLVPAQLPPGIRGFSGRAGELEKLREVVAAERSASGHAPVVIVISGVTGVGKTALATHFAQEAAKSFQDGQIYLDLAGFGPDQRPMSPAIALRHVISSMGVAPDDIPVSISERTGMYRSLVADKRMLVLLDNAYDAEQVRPLVPGGSSTLVLVTSRTRLDGLLVRDGARLINLPMLSQAESMALLIRDLGEERVAAERPAAARISSLCGHLPLALHLAAQRVHTMPHLTLAALADELSTERRLDVLVAGTDERASLRRAFGRSYDNLAAPEARLFRLASLHLGPDISSPAAAALADVSVPEARRMLEHLSASNVIGQVGPDRFTFHELLRHYAKEATLEQDTDDERRAAVCRLLHWFLHTADSACRLIRPNWQPIALQRFYMPRRPQEFANRQEALRWCEDELLNLLGGAKLAVAYGYDTIGWQLPVVLLRFFTVRQPHYAWYTAHRIGLEAAQHGGDKYGEAWNLNGLGLAYCSMRQFTKALAHFRRELQLRHMMQDSFGKATCLAGLGSAHHANGEIDKAMQYFRRSRAIMRNLGHWSGNAALHSYHTGVTGVYLEAIAAS